MLRRIFLYITLLCIGIAVWSCSDEVFTTLPGYTLSFSNDTIHMDTVFSNVPSPARSFWVYNRSGKSLRCSSVRQEKGGQSGFRVNVDGVYLGGNSGYQTSDIEILSGDSIRVFVEVTARANGQSTPQLFDDNILFTLEGGGQQKVNLNAYSWDAELLRSPVITENTTFTAEKPIVIFGSLTVEENATLTLQAGTHLYFNGNATLDVYGRLVSRGTPDSEVVLRGDRIDNMFDYLPYDFVSGQWGGVHFYEQSYGNTLDYTDIHSTYDAVVVDSSNVEKLTLDMQCCTIHNAQGYGLLNKSSWVELRNCQVTNTLRDCVCTEGGATILNNCTLAQFYPYDSARGVALRFSNSCSPLQLLCYNTLVTGYADDEIMGNAEENGNGFYYDFHNCILRTPPITDDTEHFVNVLFEDDKDTLTVSTRHFVKIDTDSLRYDFRLDSLSSAIGRADKETAMPFDRKGQPRDDTPDIGAFEWKP